MTTLTEMTNEVGQDVYKILKALWDLGYEPHTEPHTELNTELALRNRTTHICICNLTRMEGSGTIPAYKGIVYFQYLTRIFQVEVKIDLDTGYVTSSEPVYCRDAS